MKPGIKKLSESDGIVLMFEYSKDPTDTYSKRKVLLMRKMDMAKKEPCRRRLSK